MLITLINGSHHGDWCWNNYKDYLKNMGQYEIICYELLGHGKKRDLKNKKYRIDEYAKDLYIFLKTKKNNNIIAHSLGCLIMYHCLIYYFKDDDINNYVNSIIFLAPGIGVSNINIPLRITYNLLSLGTFGNKKEDIRYSLFSEYTDENVIIECQKKLEKDNHTDLVDVFIRSFFYKEITFPILFIYGKYDKICSPNSISNISHLFKEYQYKLFDSGHNLMLEYNWKDILEYIINYIDIKNEKKHNI